jgi:hypothetical protein
MTSQIINAIKHVQHFHPEVNTVVFNKQCQWLYCGDDWVIPEQFDDAIDVGILEDAADSVKELPSIYTL